MPALKYKNKPTESNGILFASKKEAKRYDELLLLVKAEKIYGLITQPRFKMDINGIRVCTYVADFYYLDEHGKQIVEDVKGYKTDVYRLKAKLFKALHPQYELREI